MTESGGLRESIHIHVFSSTRHALDALENDSTMIGSVIEVPSEAVIGVAVSGKRIYALSDRTGAFDQVETDDERNLVRGFPAYRVARAISYYDLALYPIGRED